VLEAFRALAIRVDIGVSYRDYPALLSETKVAHSKYSRSEFASLHEDLTNSLSEIVEKYEFAMEVWKVQFSNSRSTPFVLSATKPGIYSAVRSKYPDVKVDALDVGPLKGPVIFIPTVLKAIWSSAEEKLDAVEAQAVSF